MINSLSMSMQQTEYSLSKICVHKAKKNVKKIAETRLSATHVVAYKMKFFSTFNDTDQQP